MTFTKVKYIISLYFVFTISVCTFGQILTDASSNRKNLISKEKFEILNAKNEYGAILGMNPELYKNDTEEIIEGKNFFNNFGKQYSKAETMVQFNKNEFLNGKTILQFYKKKDSTKLVARYVGEMKNGYADGYGEFSDYEADKFSDAIFKRGFWKQGKLVHEKDANDAIDALVYVFDFGRKFGHFSVSNVKYEIRDIIYERDFLNRSLINYIKIEAKIFWKSNNIDHWVKIDYHQLNFYNKEVFWVVDGDESTLKNMNEIAKSRELDEVQSSIFGYFKGTTKSEGSKEERSESQGAEVIQKLLNYYNKKLHGEIVKNQYKMSYKDAPTPRFVAHETFAQFFAAFSNYNI